MKKCAKIPRSNISGICGMCGMSGISGMSRSNISGMCGMSGMSRSHFPRSNISGMPRSNPKVKYFRNAKVKSQGQIFQECQGQIPRSNISGMPRSNPKVKWENKNGKPVLTGKMGKCNKNKKTITT